MKKAKDKTKKQNPEAFKALGFIFMAVGVVFLIAVNIALGIAFMALGFIYILVGGKYQKKK